MEEIKFISLELIQNMSRDFVEDHIDKDKLREIKKKDKSPLFNVYRIAHTGKSQSTIIGSGIKVLRWFQNAVKKVHENIKLGVKAYFNHKKNTNEPAGRKELGEVVGKIFEEKPGENADSYAILYRYPEFRDIDVDMASYEGSILCPSDPTIDSWDVAPEHIIGEVSGIALGNSRENQPAFPRAEKTMQFQIQNFAEKIEAEEKKAEEAPVAKKEVKKMELEDLTKSQIKKAIDLNKLTVFDLFNRDSLLQDEEIKKIIARESENKDGVIGRHEKKIEKLEKEKGELETNLKKAETETLEANKETSKLLAVTKIETIIKDRKLDEVNPAYAKLIRKEIKKFDPTGDKDKLESEASKFVDGKIDELKSWEEDGITISMKQKEDAEKEKGNGKDNGDDKKKDAADKSKEDAEKKKEKISHPDYMQKAMDAEKELNK